MRRYESELLEYMRTRHTDIMMTIRDNGALPEGDALATAVQDFTDELPRRIRDGRARRPPTDVLASDAAARRPRTVRNETLRTE